MLRTRYIKPSILINEDLPELGPFAYILFTGLWMYADREGRFEWRPKRIKAAVMAAWDVSGNDVENLLDGLWKCGLLHRYEVDGKVYGAVANFRAHQRPHPREAESEIPPPPSNGVVSHDESGTSSEDDPRHDPGHAQDTPRMPRTRTITSKPVHIGVQGECEGERDEAPPPPKPKPPIPPPPPGACEQPEEPPPIPPEPKRPERGRSAHGMRHASAVLHPRARGEAPPRKGPGVVDWWPHSAEDVAAVRASLRALGELHRLPPPDDAIVLRVLDAARGSKGGDIHRLLRWLHHREKFREIRSWGLLPVVIGQHCSMASSA